MVGRGQDERGRDGTSKRIKWAILAALVAAICGGTAFALVSAGSSSTEIEAVSVKRERLDVAVSASGDLAAVGQRDICPQVSGTIERLPVSDGQKVRTGQVLAILDTQPLRVAQSQAWSAYQGAKAQRDTIVRSLPLGSEIAAAKSNVDQAYYAYRVARSRWRRASKYLKADKKILMEQAHAAYMQARAALDKLETASNSAGLRSADAQVDQAYRAYRKATVDVGNATVVAPVSGTLLYKTVMSPSTGQESKPAEGSGVQSGVAIFSIADLASTEFVADVDETDIGKIKTGQRALVSLDAYPDVELPGLVTSIGSLAVTTKSGGTSFPVKIRMPKAKAPLRIGMNGSADIIRVSRERALVVPYEAVLARGRRTYVFVVSGSVVKRRLVTLGMETDMAFEVTGGLQEGEKVARTKVASLKDGQPVTLR